LLSLRDYWKQSEIPQLSLKAINVKVGDGVNSIPLIKLITNSQILELEEILESFF